MSVGCVSLLEISRRLPPRAVPVVRHAAICAVRQRRSVPHVQGSDCRLYAEVDVAGLLEPLPGMLQPRSAVRAQPQQRPAIPEQVRVGVPGVPGGHAVRALQQVRRAGPVQSYPRYTVGHRIRTRAVQTHGSRYMYVDPDTTVETPYKFYTVMRAPRPESWGIGWNQSLLKGPGDARLPECPTVFGPASSPIHKKNQLDAKVPLKGWAYAHATGRQTRSAIEGSFEISAKQG
ncbi:hypothetical protein LXA43DRAFT_588243 [Ganoderma leucocontextum]|nr:hypothetical protein LXA43DRAFT_588243 [Ganoderma leucocontextum]